MAEALDTLRARWEAVARYRVVITEPRAKVGITVGSGLTWTEATKLEEQENARLRAENPGLTSWTIPMASRELENNAEALAAYRNPESASG